MKHNILLLIIFFITPFYMLKADPIELIGKISDNQTNEAIAYSTIIVKNEEIGCVSDSLGCFKLTIPEKRNVITLIVSALGYENDSVTIENINYEDSLFISLNPKNVLLDEINISPKDYKLKLLGIKKHKKNAMWNYGLPGLQRAMYFPNNENISDFYLKKVSIYIDTIGYPEGPLRLRIYSYNDKQHIPDKDLLNRNVIIRNSVGGSFVSIDLEEDYIAFPSKGLFIAIEWLLDSEDLYYEKTLKNNDKSFVLKGYGPTLGIVKKKNETRYWKKLVGSNWIDNSIKSNKIQPIINLEIIK